MIHSEDILTIPLYKPQISANKQLASVSLPCWITIALLLHAVFVHSLKTLKIVV